MVDCRRDAQVLEAHYARFGVEASFVDTCDVAAVEAAVKPNTVLLYLETPSNPTVSPPQASPHRTSPHLPSPDRTSPHLASPHRA